MKRIRIALVLFCCVATGVVYSQQAVAITHYVFPSFVKGIVLQKDGTTNEAMLNYNALSKEIVFETSPNKYLALAEPGKADTVFIDNRKFVPVNNEFYELLTKSAVPLFVQYACSVKEPGADIGYGMSSSNLPSPAVKSLIKRGGAYSLKLPDGFEATLKESYFIFRDGKFQKAGSAKQLVAVLPEKKEQVNAWVKKNNTNFSNRKEMIDLVEHLQ